MLPRVDGPVFGTAVHAGAGRTQDRGARPRARRRGRAPWCPAIASPSGRSRSSSSASPTASPDCVAVALHTPQGVLVHTGDFKIDYTPLDHQPTDLGRLAELGAAGVLALFADSTNVDRRGVTGSETDVVDAFDELFATTEGKLVVASFASSVYRMQLIVDLAAKFDRQVAFVGRGMQENSQIAQRLGYLRVPTGVGIKDADVGQLPRRRRRVPGHRLAGRAAGGAVAHRHRRPPSRLARARRHRRALGPGHSRQREADRPGRQPPGPAPGRRGDRGDAPRPRLGPRQRRRAEAGAVAGAAALPGAGPRRVPPAVAPRAGRRAGHRRPAGADAGAAGRERPPAALRRRGRPRARHRAHRARADRRHAHRRGGRRDAARPPPPRRRRPGRAGGGGEPSDRAARRRARDSSPAASCPRPRPATCSRTAPPSWPR